MLCKKRFRSSVKPSSFHRGFVKCRIGLNDKISIYFKKINLHLITLRRLNSIIIANIIIHQFASLGSVLLKEKTFFQNWFIRMFDRAPDHATSFYLQMHLEKRRSLLITRSSWAGSKLLSLSRVIVLGDENYLNVIKHSNSDIEIPSMYYECFLRHVFSPFPLFSYQNLVDFWCKLNYIRRNYSA